MSQSLKQTNKRFMIKEYYRILDSTRKTVKFIENEIKKLEKEYGPLEPDFHDRAGEEYHQQRIH
jgi:cell division protein FtsB